MPILRILLFTVAVCTISTACSSEGPTPEPTAVPAFAGATHEVTDLLDLCREHAAITEFPEGFARWQYSEYLKTLPPCPMPGDPIRILGNVYDPDTQPTWWGEYPEGTVSLTTLLPFGQNRWGEADEWLQTPGAILLGMSNEDLVAGDAISALCAVEGITRVGVVMAEAFVLEGCELEEVIAKVPPTPTRIPWSANRTPTGPTPTSKEVQRMQAMPTPVPTPRPIWSDVGTTIGPSRPFPTSVPRN